MGPRGPQGLFNYPQGAREKKNWGAKFFENSIFHEFLITGGQAGPRLVPWVHAMGAPGKAQGQNYRF